MSAHEPPPLRLDCQAGRPNRTKGPPAMSETTHRDPLREQLALTLAEAALCQSTAAVQLALDQFIAQHGRPSVALTLSLRTLLTESTRAALAEFFGERHESV